MKKEKLQELPKAYFVRTVNGDLFHCEKLTTRKTSDGLVLVAEGIMDHNLKSNCSFPKGIIIAWDKVSWTAQDPVVV